jgi:transposase-like protein
VVERFATFHHYQRQEAQGMTSAELKHQAKLREWATAIQDCRSSGQSVRQWCRERGITTATYYRWEREVLSIASATPELPEPTSSVAFAELPTPKQPGRNIAECSATLRIGKASLELHQEMTPELLKVLVEILRLLQCKGVERMTSVALKHQAKAAVWRERIVDCRGREMTVRE